MNEALKEAALICKTCFRNGYDAHVVNAPLQQHLFTVNKKCHSVDIACDAGYSVLVKIFPDAQPAPEGTRFTATLEQDGITYRFYPLLTDESAHPELAQLRLTPTMIQLMPKEEQQHLKLTGFGGMPPADERDPYEGFEPFATGVVKLAGLPDDTLRHNYLLAIRAMRFAANFDLPIEENTGVAIIRASSRILNYVPAKDILDEWRKVDAEAMYRFITHMHELHILQGLIPELSALSCIKEARNKRTNEMMDVLTHTINCVRLYPEANFHYDWLGTVAMLFHDIGKTYTAEYIEGTWTFYQHHKVGAAVTRKILRRLQFPVEDIDLICHLVRSHMYFYFMMTDRGIRRFMAMDEYPRLIEMAKADMLARDGSTTSFNHNMKYLERAAIPEQMLEPLLNGNEIMQECKLKPGPQVGVIRDALLKAQVAGDVTDLESAKAFVRHHAETLA